MLRRTPRLQGFTKKFPNLWEKFLSAYDGIKLDFAIETKGIEEVEEFLANLSEKENTILNTENDVAARIVIIMDHFGREDLGTRINRLLLEIIDKIDSHHG